MKLLQYFPLLLLGGLLACQKPTDDTVGPAMPVAYDSLAATPTAIGQPVGAPTTKTIGPAGGTITTSNGRLSIIVPAGAVKKETAITVQPTENKAPNGVGQAFAITPNIAFEQNVTVVYSYRDDELAGAAVEAMGLAFQDGRHAWQQRQKATVDKTKKTISAKLKNSRVWALMTQYKLEPAQDTVLVSGHRELSLTRVGVPVPSGDDMLAALVPTVVNNDVAKLYINGVDVTSSVQKDPTYGTVGYDPKTSSILYTAPSQKPKNNLVTVSVEIKRTEVDAQIVLSNQLTIISSENLIIDGHSFDNLTANGTLLNGHLTATVVGVDSTGKSGQLSLFLNSLAVGAHPFSNDVDLPIGTSIDVLNGAGKGDNIQGSSFYSTCLVPLTESGTVQVVKAERTNGQTAITLQISGNVVTKHIYKTDGCTVIEHKTMTVNARISLLARG